MDDKELIGAVHSAVYHQCQRLGYSVLVDVLIDIGVPQGLSDCSVDINYKYP